MLQNKMLLIICLAVLILFTSCSNSTGPDNPETKWMAVQANYYEQGFSHIYLVDYTNPSSFKKLTKEDHNFQKPSVSPDRKSIIIEDRTLGDWDNPALICYNIENDSLEYLKYTVPRGLDPITGNSARWSPDSESFYYYIGTPFQLPDIHSYNISTKNHIMHTRADTMGTFVLDCIDEYTMISWFSRVREAGTEDNGYYLTDSDANYISKLSNPHLVYIVVNDHVYQGAMNLRYNPSSNLVVFTQKDSVQTGYGIAVTDLEGTFIDRYTTGYRDYNPCWGPDKNTILFDRADIDDKGRKYTSIMKLDIQSGNVSEIITPNSIEGSEGVRNPDY